MSHASILPLPAASTLPEAKQAATLATAQKFEAMALNQLLQPMFDTVDTSNSLFGGGEGEKTWRPMLVNEMATAIVKGGGLGLTEPVYQQMLRLQEGGTDQDAAARGATPRTDSGRATP